MSASLGLHVARFEELSESTDGPAAVFALAETAERAGFDELYVMDHFFQVPQAGGAERPMLEAYTLLGALAGRTSTLRLGTLVTGVTYRNPALLAKIATTLDYLSNGRAILGLGAAWYEQEHEAFGFEFAPVRDRMRLLEDTVRICRAMFDGEDPTVSGELASIDGAWNRPAPVQAGGPPIMIGGTGERHTLRIAAAHADVVNINSDFAELPHKLAVLEQHLTTAGRTRRDISVSTLALVVPGRDDAEAEERLAAMVQARGVDPAALSDPAVRDLVTARMLVGGPDTLARQAADVMAHGLDGLVVNLPSGPMDRDLALVADALRPVLTA